MRVFLGRALVKCNTDRQYMLARGSFEFVNSYTSQSWSFVAVKYNWNRCFLMT